MLAPGRQWGVARSWGRARSRLGRGCQWGCWRALSHLGRGCCRLVIIVEGARGLAWCCSQWEARVWWQSCCTGLLVIVAEGVWGRVLTPLRVVRSLVVSWSVVK